MRGALLTSLVGCLGLGCAAPEPTTELYGPLELVLLHTADTHSELFPWQSVIGAGDARRGLARSGELAEVGGFARLGSVVRGERARAGRSLHLDAGDLFQGSLTFERYLGEPEVLAFDALGVDAQALGNHELDQGAELLSERYRTLAHFPLLAANYRRDGAGGLADLVQPFVLLDAGGLRVGVIGVGNASSVGLLKARPNAAAVLAEDAAQAVQGALDLLRPVADVVVALTHLGLDADHALVRATSGLDAVLGGHQHIALDEPDWEADCAGSANGTVRDAWGGERRCVTRRVPIVHSGAYGKFVGRLALELDDAPERLGADYDPLDAFEVTAVSFELLPVRADTPDDPGVAELLEPYRPPFADALGLDEVVAFVPDLVERYGATGADSPLGNLAAEAVRAAAGSDLAVIGASSLRHDLPPGLLDLEGLVRVLPFEDPIVSAELPGRTVARAFEHAARSASGRECRSQVHVAGALVRFTCPCAGNACAQVFAPETAVVCASDADCSAFSGACRGRDGEVGACYAPLDAGATYRVATTEYLAGGGSGLFDPIPVTARTRRDEPLSGAVAELVRGEASCAKGEGSADIERCADALAERAERACSARGLADGCGGAASLRARALEACRYVPCLDRALGAARDGRIRFEVP